jgi:hypothetical protein
MGHKCKEPPYGFGWPLEIKLEVLTRIAFVPPFGRSPARGQ